MTEHTKEPPTPETDLLEWGMSNKPLTSREIEILGFARRLETRLSGLNPEAVGDVVAALERAEKLIRLLTVHQVIESGDEAINAAGLNPWAMNEGLATGNERLDAWWIEAALAKLKGEAK